MGNKRVGADGDDLIEEVHGEEIVGKGDADCPEDGQGEAGVKTGLSMFFKAAHVPH